MMERVKSGIMYLIYCKTFCKCHNVPPPNTSMKKINISLLFTTKFFLLLFGVFFVFCGAGD
jgi:hypothetical protein